MSTFAERVRKSSKKLIAKVEENHHKVALELFMKIQEKSPVDTGELRRSWVIHKVPNGYVISTPVPYAPILEYGLYPNPPRGGKDKTVGGFSKQAPQGFVRISIKEVANQWK